MKKILLTTTIIASLLTMTACSSGGKNASKGSNKTVSFNKNGAGGNNADLPSSKNLEVRSDDAGNKINKEKKTEAVKVLSNGKVYEVKLETIKPKSGKKIARNPLKFTFKKKKRNPLKVIPTFNTENKEAKARAVSFGEFIGKAQKARNPFSDKKNQPSKKIIVTQGEKITIDGAVDNFMNYPEGN